MAMSSAVATRALRRRVLAALEALHAPESRIGGKAAGLARLTRAGARVPPWIVVPVEAFDEHLRHVDEDCALSRELERLMMPDRASVSDRAALERVTRALQARITGQPPSVELLEEMSDGCVALGGAPWVVRSSALGEDSARLSYAGQYDSFLNIDSVGDVADAVLRCWASAVGARALAYRMRAGEAPRPARMAVIVQRLIVSDVAGVLFTTDPRTGRRDRALISACWGLGEGLVNGSCDADEIVVDADGRELDVRIACKELRVVAVRDGGTRHDPVPVALQRTRAISPQMVSRLASEGRRISDALGAPQDIEWALERDTLYLLQARPITARAFPRGDDGPRTVWDNSNIQESYCGVTTPLTFSFAAGAYASVYEQTMRALGLPERTIAAHRPLLRRLLGILRGRIYYNIENWYRGLLLLPSFGRNKADMEAMMGVEKPVDFIVDERLGAWDRLRRLPRMLGTLARLVVRFHRLPRDTARWLDRFEAHHASVDRPSLKNADLSTLGHALQRIRDDLIERWETPIINDFFVMMATGRLRRFVERTAPDESERLLPALLGGIDGLASAEPPRQLMRLAAEVRADPALASILIDDDVSDLLPLLRERVPEFAARLDAWLEAFGDRAMGELKLETLSLRDEPSFVFRVLRNYLGRPDLDADALARRERMRHDAAVESLRRRLGPFGRRLLHRLLDAARRGIRARESMRLARTRLFGLVRETYAAVGLRLHEAGRLDSPRDVFYLTVEEIDAYLSGTAVSADLAGIARVRRAEYRDYEGAEMPGRLETRGTPYLGGQLREAGAAAAPAGSVLRGIPVSSGIAEGCAAVVTSPGSDLEIDGRVLVALRTDPGWAPLFPSAAAIVVERGSSLSHSAVLARELGIPAVVGVPGLMATVQSGERLRVDGSLGAVTRLEAR
jgi:pyruvate,water dikinase